MKNFARSIAAVILLACWAGTAVAQTPTPIATRGGASVPYTGANKNLNLGIYSVYAAFFVGDGSMLTGLPPGETSYFAPPKTFGSSTTWVTPHGGQMSWAFNGTNGGYGLQAVYDDNAYDGFLQMPLNGLRIRWRNSPQALVLYNNAGDATKTSVEVAAHAFNVISGAVNPGNYTKAQIDGMSPAVGDTIHCIDCTVPYDTCTGTAAVVSGYRAETYSAISTVVPGTLVPKGCGSGQ